jgi:nicotinate-nucleotide adenylyltransferase
MRFFRRASIAPKRLGILPGTFNPVTVAHVSLAHAALTHVDEVVFVLPRVFPHKDYSGASFEERVAMLDAAVDGPSFSIAEAAGGLFIEIARECRATYGETTRLSLLCGRDAAERIVGWDYGRPEAIAEMFREFDLLVAARNGEYDPPPEFAAAIRCLDAAAMDSVSATDVRERAAHGDVWEHLVPEGARDLARRIYTPQKFRCS